MASDFDPYRPLAPNLPSGDRLNGWLLKNPRRQIVRLVAGQRVLDVGCGTGSLVALLAAAGCQAMGVDSSPTMLAFARQKQIPAQLERLDAAALPFEAEFDAAVISLALHEMPPRVRAQVWAGMRRAVVSGGRLIALDFAVPARRTPWARLAAALVRRDERDFLSIYPPHYHNFEEFMRQGGVTAWVPAQGRPAEAEFRYWGGVLAVVAARA